MAGRKTPVMQQHAAAKQAYPDAVLFFRLGDFYEMFGDDAVLCARELDLTLTSRSKGKADEIPMAGVPHHAAHGYIGRLLTRGYKVAICEQMADPATVKGIVPRQVVRVLTPGLVTAQEHLEASANNWLAALDVADDGELGVALLDISTGELRAAQIDALSALLGELTRHSPRELVVGQVAADAQALDDLIAMLTASGVTSAVRKDPPLSEGDATEHLGGLAAEIAHLGEGARRAAARALRFAHECMPGATLPVRRVARFEPSQTLVIDATTQRHLELLESNQGGVDGSLLHVVNQTRTAPGARLLRRRLLAPLMNIQAIRRRLDLVELFVVHSGLRREVREALGRVGDLERLSVRAFLGEASPKDLGNLRDGLHAASDIISLLDVLKDPAERESLGLGAGIDAVADVAAALTSALVERPPAQAKDGQIFLVEYDTELAEFAKLRTSGADLITELEARFKQDLQIPTLKARYTRVFGWYLEVSRSQLSRVPESWRRKQTVAGGERYTTEELDELADRIAHAEERHRARELELWRKLVELVKAASERIGSLSERIAQWDCAAALAEVAHRYDYVRPNVDDSYRLDITEGRHPVVERLAAQQGFVPNDVVLECDAEQMWIVTGPNMAGKSTLLRQTALITILAQMGSYVPAREATVGLVDRVLSRVGASDNLARGESTFMVEMKETAEILRSATRRSLVILDEIGRGTSTFDGLAIAWAVAEHLDETVRCRALFATHYHELTELADASSTAANYSVSARELEGDIVFLHRLVKGPASKSYGVAVAKLAGLPAGVLARAQALLESFETSDNDTKDSGGVAPRPARRHAVENQLSLFHTQPAMTEQEREAVSTLRAVDTDRLTPLEALQLVDQLKRRL